MSGLYPTDKCRVCARPSTTNYDPDRQTMALCDRHARLAGAALNEARALDPWSRSLGFGVPRFPGSDPDSSAAVDLRCDRAEHLWIAQPGVVCPWCFSIYLDTLRDTRTQLLGQIEVEENDHRYVEEVARRGQRLVNAVSIGLLSQDEARHVFDRWCAHVA